MVMKQYDVPILLIVFKRIESTNLILNELRKVRPRYLYIVADGPRSKKEKKETDSLRKFILREIDWPCKVKKLFRKENWGCDKSSVDALTWFFKNVEYGIFLEDDCLPSPSFFKFHKEMLERYKDKNKIKCVCAVNFLKNYKIKDSYTFSKTFFSGWGFSTWSREWNLDYEKVRNESKKGLKEAFPHLFHRLSIRKKINFVLNGKMQGWDYMFASQKSLENKLAIVPAKNLVENIGFDFESTHKFNKADKKYLKVKRQEIDFPLKHPNKVGDDSRYNKKLNFWLIRKFIERNIRKIIK
jgi:hypothetical protein